MRKRNYRSDTGPFAHPWCQVGPTQTGHDFRQKLTAGFFKSSVWNAIRNFLAAESGMRSRLITDGNKAHSHPVSAFLAPLALRQVLAAVPASMADDISVLCWRLRLALDSHHWQTAE